MLQLSDLDLTKTYSYADYYSWKFEERVELYNGKVHLIPRTDTNHQVCVGYIMFKLYNFLKGKRLGEVYHAPFDIRIPENSKADKDVFNVFQPDISGFCDHSNLDDRGGIGTPDIVIEVLRSIDCIREFGLEYELCERAGVKEYWIVSYAHQYVQVYILVDGKFIATQPKTNGQIVTTPILPGFSLDVSELFSDLHVFEKD